MTVEQAANWRRERFPTVRVADRAGATGRRDSLLIPIRPGTSVERGTISIEALIMPESSTNDVEPDALVKQALSVIRSDRLPYLATADKDQPRLRPVAPVKTDGFTVYIANLRSHGKTAELEANPRVELCYLDGHNDQVRITGLAEVVTDAAVCKKILAASPQLRQHMSDAEISEFVLYKIVPSRVRFMKEWALTYREVPFQRGDNESAKPR